MHKPVPGQSIPPDTRDYFRARAKRHAYDLVMRELTASKISKAELARRLGKGADRVSKMLAGPANWTIITLADLLFAIGGGVPSYSVDYPLDKPARNFGPKERFEIKKETTGRPVTIKPVEPPPQQEAA